MFYEGDLKSGIERALCTFRQVVCFITDEGHLSYLWEERWLRDERIQTLFSDTAVVFRILEGSREAELLDTFCPAFESPTVIVIKFGIIREYIAKTTEEYMVKQRLIAALEDTRPPRRVREAMAHLDGPAAELGCVLVRAVLRACAEIALTLEASESSSASPDTVSAASSSSPSTTSAACPALASAQAAAIPPPDTSAADVPMASDASLTSAEAPAAPSGSVDATDVPEESSTQQLDAREGKRPAEPEDERDEQLDWRNKQRRREQQEHDDSERILEQIRLDNEARKAKPEQQKSTVEATQHNSSNSQQPPAGRQYRLQVRLLDGSTIKNTFSPEQTISSAVRSWLDADRTDGDAPYTLKHILTPRENKTISASEENSTLRELGVGPTATLVMVPTKPYVTAYNTATVATANETGPAMPYRVISGGYNLVSGTVGSVAGMVGSVLGIGQDPEAVGRRASTPAPDEPAPAATQNVRGSVRNRIRTLHDSNSDKDDQQFYNGNQLNFEPRKKDDE